MPEQRRGVVLGAAAYAMWGLFPLYWPLLKPASAMEILACRMVWSLVFVVIVLAVLGKWSWIRTLRGVTLARLGLAAAVITVNWGTYIWGVNNGHVVDTSLGYFINPIVTVLFGVVLLRERIRPWQWAAVGLGGVSVVVLVAGYGKVPWIAFVLAFSFATYGLIKKTVGVPALESLTVETALLFLPATGYLVWLQSDHRAAFGHHSAGNTLLLIGAGAVTAIPLLAFAASANRVPLSMLGLLQFIAPVLQFGCGVLVNHESVPPARLAGFCIVWLALAALTYDALRSRARSARTPVRDNREYDLTPVQPVERA